jgi:hypothetical protein
MAYAGDLKSLVLRDVRVRLPPRAPTYFIEGESINTLLFFVYLWRTLFLKQNEWISTPRTYQIRFELFLPRSYPWSVMLLRDPNALVPKQD